MSAKIRATRSWIRVPTTAVAVLIVCAATAQTAVGAPDRSSTGAPHVSVSRSAMVSAEPASTVDGAATDQVDPAVVELDLEGIDDTAQDELVSIAHAQPDLVVSADPESDPGLTTQDALGVLSDASATDVLTERLGVEPFSVMGVTWDLDPALEGVVVQYRVYQADAWTPWSWVAPSEPYLEPGGLAPTRGATDAIFVPDSTGVQVLVSSTAGAATGVKIVLIDPGAGPDGTGASLGSGAPVDGAEPPGKSADDSSTSTVPDPEMPVDESTSPPALDDPAVPTNPADPFTPHVPSAPDATVSPEPAPTPSEEVAPTPTPTSAPDLDSEDDVSNETMASATASQSSAHAVSTVSSPATAVVSTLRTAVTAKPRIVNRAEWGASQPVCAMDRASATLTAAVHHTASTNSYTAAQVPALLRGFAEYHTRPEANGGRGWCDIGYNFLVDKFGTVYEGRAASIDEPVVGVHTGGFNSRTVGVAAIGNYQEIAPSAVLIEGVSQIIAWKFAQNRILANTSVTLISGGGASKYPAGTAVTFSTIFGHRDAQFTSCPGIHLYSALGSIRNRVAALSNQTVAESPYGAWDTVKGGAGSVRVTGWAVDPDVSSPVKVQVFVDGALVTTVTASNNRSDVGARGFDATAPAAAGSRIVCLRLVNQGGGADVHMGCRSATSTTASPVGVIDAVSATESSIRVRGWARDPDSTSPIQVHVYIDGRATASVTANLSRPDVQAAAPGSAGPAHGFDRTLSVSTGRHTVCVYGINVGPGSSSAIGCRDVMVENARPIGSLDVVVATGPDRISVRGWALDPDTSSSIAVHVYVDGRLAKGLVASGNRPDVERAHGRGAAHGFTTELTVASGTHEVCLYAIDSSGGVNPRVGCRSVTVVNETPKGVVDGVTSRAGEVSVRGWAFDPDATLPISVHVYVNGAFVGEASADGARPDVARVYGTSGAHGFVASFAAPRGQATACVYAINSPRGGNPLLGCHELTVT